MFVRFRKAPNRLQVSILETHRVGGKVTAVAQNNLGIMYRDGAGVPQNYVAAHMWFNLAAANPGMEAERRNMAVLNRDFVARRMTPDQIAEAQKLASEWKPKQ